MRFILAVAVVLFVAGPALAVDLSGVRCEDQAIKDGIVTHLKQARTEAGRSVLSYGLHVKDIRSAKTRRASRSRVVCDIVLRTQYGGHTQTERLIYMLELQRDGRIMESWR